MTDPTPESLELARRILLEHGSYDHRAQESWEKVARELDAVQQPLRDSNKELNRRIGELESQLAAMTNHPNSKVAAGVWKDRCEVAEARVAELETDMAVGLEALKASLVLRTEAEAERDAAFVKGWCAGRDAAAEYVWNADNREAVLRITPPASQP